MADQPKKRGYKKVGGTPASVPPGDFPPNLVSTDIEAPLEASASYDRAKALIFEMVKRRCEALRLYEPLEKQQAFHMSKAPERILRGSNRSGKTLSAAVEVARAVSNQDPFGKYPAVGRVIAVGKDSKHLGETMWYKLGRSRPFKMIRDKVTGLWRSYRPTDPSDIEREREAKPAPPLLPPRFVPRNGIVWEDKKGGVPKKVVCSTGWEILFFSSLGKPPQGLDCDLVWFDEEIEDPEWYSEMASRLLDRKGKFIWSATPQAATQDLYDLHCRAVDGDPLVDELHVKLSENPHISEDQKIQLAAKLSPEQRRVRIDGEYAITSYKVYPEFNKGTHITPHIDIPPNWYRICAIDPGRQVLAAIFMALPPPEIADRHDHIYLYDELYLEAADAKRFGHHMKIKVGNDSISEFLIDSRAARVTEMASGKTVSDQYTAALRSNGVKSERTGFGFIWGSTDVKARELSFRDWLVIRHDGTPRLLVVEGKAPNFIREIERYHYKRIRGLITDDPEQKNNHTIDCCQYIAARNPKYRKPIGGGRGENYAARALRLKRERQKQRSPGDSYISLGPGGGEYGRRSRR